jgi:hypothetical protein
MGEVIACNKVAGKRAGLCRDAFTVEISRGINDANVLVLGAKVTPPDEAEATAANDDAPIDVAGGNRTAHRGALRRVVHLRVAVRPRVGHDVPTVDQRGDESRLDRDTVLVGGDRYPQRRSQSCMSSRSFGTCTSATRGLLSRSTRRSSWPKQKAEAELYDNSALRIMSPWLIQQLEEARQLLGRDFWSYGHDANRDVLTTFLRCHHEQGLSRLMVTPDELFAPESTESALICAPALTR